MKILFWGGTGQAKVMRPIADSIGKLEVIFDDTVGLESPFNDIPIYCGWKEFLKLKEVFKDYYFSVTIGNPNGQTRIDISNKLISEGLFPISLIDESANIQNNIHIEMGVQIHPFVAINSFTTIGKFCILNTRCVIEHDDVLDDGVEIGPGAILCGNVHVGKNSWIGAGAVIRQNITIGSNVIVGIGSAVVKDIPDNKVIVGVPGTELYG